VLITAGNSPGQLHAVAAQHANQEVQFIAVAVAGLDASVADATCFAVM
jgi:hypothetical protein